MYNRMMKFLVLFLFASLIISCAALEKSKNDNKTSIPSGLKPYIKSIAILGDVCSAEYMGYLQLDESIEAQKDAVSGINAGLVSKGYSVIECPMPFVGSYMTGEAATEVIKGADVVMMKAPYAVPDIFDKDREYYQSLAKVIDSIALIAGSDDVKSKEKLPVLKGEVKDDLSRIEQKTKTNALLVFIGQGILYQKEKLLINSESGINMQGNASNAPQIIDLRKDTVKARAFLIDYKTSKILWSDSVDVEMPEVQKQRKDFYKTAFASAMLKDFPAR